MLFGGFAAGAAGPPDSSGSRAPVPLGARLLATDPLLWGIDFPSLVISHERTSVAVFGSSTATSEELRDLVDGVPDSALVRWAGSYTLVHSTPTSTTILTDPAGAQPIYYAPWENGVVWASSSRALAGLISAEVDKDWLTARLRGSSSAESAFSGVRRAPPGARITLSAGGSVRIDPAWRPTVTDVDAGVERLRSALTLGVRARVADTGRVTADCSGGLDSTVLCLLCGPSRVVAVNSQPAEATTGGDLDFVAALDAAYPDVRRTRILLGSAELPYSGLDRLVPTDEPPRSVVVTGRLATVWARLRELESELHFSGDGADALFGVPLGYLADLARVGRRPWRAWRDAREWAYVLGRTPRSVLSSSAPPVLDDVRSTALSAAADLQLAAAHGIRYANPYLDNRVVDAVLGVPVWKYASPRTYKPLLTRAFGHLLPDAIAQRRTKGTFLADHYQGIRANLATLTELVDGELAGLGLVSPPSIVSTLERAAAGVGVDLTLVERVVGTEAWLRTVRREPCVRWDLLP